KTVLTPRTRNSNSSLSFPHGHSACPSISVSLPGEALVTRRVALLHLRLHCGLWGFQVTLATVTTLHNPLGRGCGYRYGRGRWADSSRLAAMSRSLRLLSDEARTSTSNA